MRVGRLRVLARWSTFMVLIATAAFAQQPPATPRRGRLPPGFPGGPAGAANGPTDPLSGPPRPTAAPAVDLSGPWKGVFCWDICVEFADLTLETSPDRRELTGELRFTAIPSEALRLARPDPEKVWSIRGRIDPGSNAVFLTPPPPPLRGPLGAFEQRPLDGVFAASRNEIAGQFHKPYATAPDPNETFFLFVRAGDGKDRAAAVARLKSFAEHAAAAAPPAKGSGSGSPPNDGALAKWAAPYEVEYGASAGTGGVEQISQRALPLLSDATFQPVFGEAYDRIDFGTLQKGMRRLTDPKLAREHGFMQYALWPSPSKLVSVAAMRTIDAWKDEMLARFRSGPPVASAFDDLAATQKAIGEREVYVFPSVKKRTDEEIEQLRGKLSGSSLSANVDRAIAVASGLEGAKALASWAKDNDAMLQRLPAAERETAVKRVEARLDELLQSLLAASEAGLAKLGTGEPAVRAGAAWYQSLQTQFAFAPARPPVVAAVQKLRSRRDPDLAAGSEGILRRIEGCKSPEEVDALFASDLSVPGDDASPAYAALAEAGRARKQRIEDDRVLALFSPEEREIMDRPGHLDLRKAKERPPTAEEVRLALVRGWAFGTGKVLDAHTARYVDRAQLAFPFPMHVQFTNEQLISAQQIEGTNDYDCEFHVLLQVALTGDNVIANYDEVTRAQSLNMLKLVNAFCVGMSTESDHKVLRLTERGWQIPELLEAGAIQGAFGRMIEGR